MTTGVARPLWRSQCSTLSPSMRGNPRSSTNALKTVIASAVSSIVTPFMLEYGHDYPAVYALELLPVYDAIARVKVQAHWQTDVLAGWALGSGTAWLIHRSPNSPSF
jgi:hypothetical protein